MGRLGQLIAAAALCGLAACSVFERDTLPPRGEVIVVVDTDLPVPRVVSRLRIDVYAEDGTWLATRDDVRPDPRDWPTSFSVFTDDESRAHVVFVRLRAYLDGRVVPYRLLGRVADGATPDSEPDPSLAVDRVVRVRLTYGTRGRALVTLRGACAGVAARLSLPSPPDSCADDGPALAPVRDVPTDDLDATPPSAVGSFGFAACGDEMTSDGVVCVPGGAFVFGDAFYRPTDPGDVRPTASHPERIVRLTRFTIDRDEVTVARYRGAVARGLVAPTAVVTNDRDGPPSADPSSACTWSATPRGRESYPLSCVTWDTARAFCRFEGGDLPTEAQWEYAALAAGRAAKSTYPWGDEPPSCERAIYGRSLAFGNSECIGLGEGVQPAPAQGADVSALGVRNLTGSLEEHVRDDHARLSEPCWTGASPVDPICEIAPPPECAADRNSLECRASGGIVKSLRGGSWLSRALELRVVDRDGRERLSATSNSLIGFRCVHPAP